MKTENCQKFKIDGRHNGITGLWKNQGISGDKIANPKSSKTLDIVEMENHERILKIAYFELKIVNNWRNNQKW